jgi:hypothetical protein
VTSALYNLEKGGREDGCLRKQERKGYNATLLNYAVVVKQKVKCSRQHLATECAHILFLYKETRYLIEEVLQLVSIRRS